MTTSRTVRVFLSSTFRDFAEERDLLVKKVFPELRRRCRERQVELVDVDLRWGITEEQAQRGEVLPICLAEIDRSRPYFMGFIGDRYGWVPEHHQFDQSLLVEQPWLDEHRGGKSVTELEMLHGVLNNPLMKDRAFFYFRNSEYSQSKGGPYLSEGPESALKLEALKDRIRTSGFPVVENYPNPEALAEKVQEDLWKVIDETFPEEDVPDPLTLERRKHEAYGGSRLGLYLGGKQYFTALDAAMAAEPFAPVLITGSSGGGKSALIANWSRAYKEKHPETLEIVHYLGSGADAADPVKLVSRLLQEIARITGDELKIESDPQKILNALPEWLARASSYAEREGRGWLILLDGLDKLSNLRDLRWWPGFLPPRMKLVVSCLDGEVQDEARKRMGWSEIKVTPLTDNDTKDLIVEYLGRYRKSLTPEQIARVQSHPLSGNPLFLRTLLEELRIFGVYEELEARMAGYLAAETIDALFAKVFARVEEDNRAEDVRSAMEVLWGSLESFAEDELLAITGLVPAVWSPILNALSESLISTNGRLALGHDYFRKAVEDRYLTTEESKESVYKRLSDFCAEAMEREGRKANSPYVRRQAVRHFLMAEAWDEAANALSDLDYIEVRARRKELSALIMDYFSSLKLLPEARVEAEIEKARQDELDRWAKDITNYSVACSEMRKLGPTARGIQEPLYPVIPKTIKRWSEEEIAKEVERIREYPDRLDRVRDFKHFVATNARILDKFAGRDGFVAQHAYNSIPGGPVYKSAQENLEKIAAPLILRNWHQNDLYNPLPECIRIIDGHWGIIFRASESCISISENARFAITAEDDGGVRLWNLINGELIYVLKGHTGKVESVSISADGSRGVSTCSDMLILWDLEKGENIKTITGDLGVVCISAEGNLAITGKNDIIIWNLESGKCLGNLKGHTEKVTSLWLRSDLNTAVSSSRDDTIKIWDLITLECKKTIKDCHNSSIESLGVSKNGKIAISGNWDNVKAWNLETGDCTFEYTNKLLSRDCKLTSIKISADGLRAVSSSDDKTIQVWDLEKGECVQIIRGHTRPINSVCISADGCRAYSVGRDSSFRVWDLEKGIANQYSEGHADSIRSLSISENNNYAVSSTDSEIIARAGDGSIRVWDLTKNQSIYSIKGLVIGDEKSRRNEKITCVKISRDGKRALSCNGGDVIEEWDLNNGTCINTISIKDVANFSVSDDWRTIITISKGFTKCINIIDIASGECIKKFDAGLSAEISANGDYALVVGDESDDDRNNIQIWNIKRRECENICKGHTKYVIPMALSVSGSRILSGSIDGTIRVWDLKNACCLHILNDHRDAEELSLIADGKIGLSASFYSDKTLRLWDLDKGECLNVMHEQSMTSMTSNGKFIAIGCTDGCVKTYRIHNLHI